MLSVCFVHCSIIHIIQPWQHTAETDQKKDKKIVKKNNTINKRAISTKKFFTMTLI